MLDMGRKTDDTVKVRATRRVLEHRQEYRSLTAAIAAIAEQEKVSTESLRRWVRQAEVDTGLRPGVSTTESEEIRKLKSENRRLREDVAILRAATSFFAGELDPRNR
jgi:transposase-like protein